MSTRVPRVPTVRPAPDDLDELVRSYRLDGRPELQDRITQSLDWLVMMCVRRVRWHDESLDDLAQVARMGLLEAIARFDPSRGVRFRTFAEATMIGTIRHHRRSSLQVKVPRSMQHLNGQCRSAVDRLTASLGRTPTTAEIADDVGIGRSAVRAALEVDALFHPMPLSTDESGGANGSLEDHICVDDAMLESTAERMEVLDALSDLPDRQRTIVFLHFYEGCTQAEIGARLGISQVQVSRLMAAALASIRSTWSDTALRSAAE